MLYGIEELSPKRLRDDLLSRQSEIGSPNQVNDAAESAKEELKILADMASDHGVPTWFIERIRAVAEKIITVPTEDRHKGVFREA